MSKGATAITILLLLLMSACSGDESSSISSRVSPEYEVTVPPPSPTAVPEPMMGKFTPPPGQTVFIIGQDVANTEAYIEDVGPIPGGFTGYSSLSRQEGITDYINYGSGPHHLDHLAETLPDSVIVLGLYLVDYLEHINAGIADKRIHRLLDHLESYDRPVFLRFGYEFDGPWNHYDPEEYVEAWRYFHHLMVERGIENVALVWQSATNCDGTFGNSPLSAWYPGDEYVDWMGLSYFVQADCDYKPIEELLEYARAHQKPVMISESTPQRYDLQELTFSSDGRNYEDKTAEIIWQEWYRPYFDLIHSNSDVIRTIIYINARWDDQLMWGPPYSSGYWGDSRVQADDYILERWRSEINKVWWLHADADLFAILGG